MNAPPTFFEPQAANDHFVALCALPHASGREDPVRAYVAAVLDQLGVPEVFYLPEATEPGQRVIRARRPGRGALAGASPVVLQAHLDMVTVPDEQIFPLELYLDPADPKWLRARHQGRATTLGADNGIGVALILALLAEPALQDYPLEALFTVEEETGMGGVRDFDPALLQGRRLLNLDSEDLPLITYGGAGGTPSHYQLPLERAPLTGAWATLELTLAHLTGGHSGIDINKGRANAVKLLAEALARLDRRLNQLGAPGGIGAYDLRLVAIGQPAADNKTNVIPSRASAVVQVPEAEAAAFRADLAALLALFRAQLQPIEPNLTLTIGAGVAEWPALTPAATDAVLTLLQQVPHGVLRMIPAVPEVVETSANLARVRTGAEALSFTVSNRSANLEHLHGLTQQHRLVGARAGASVTTGDDHFYPPWEPNPASAVLKAAQAVYDQHLPGHRSEVIHAGLECGWIVAKYRDDPVPMDCIALGPTMRDVHSINERLDVTSVKPFYTAVVAIIQKLFA